MSHPAYATRAIPATRGRPLRLPFLWSDPRTHQGISLVGATITATLKWPGAALPGTYKAVNLPRGRVEFTWTAEALANLPETGATITITVVDTAGAFWDAVYPVVGKVLP